MPKPSTSLATLRPDLGASFEEFDLAADREGFISQRVLPVINVGKPADKFGLIPLEQLLKEEETQRSSTGGYPRGEWTFTDNSYSTQEYGHEEPVDDRDARIYEDYFNAEVISAGIARDRVLRGGESRVSSLVFNATTWTGSGLKTAVENEWDDAANATPITDVEAAVRKVYNGTGLYPNALVIDRSVFRNLRLVTQIKDAISASGAGDPNKATDITVKMLAEVFDLRHILVAGGAKNTADEGLEATIAALWSGEFAMVCKIAETNSIKEPCIGRTFHYSGDGSEIGGTMESYRDEIIRGDVIRVRNELDELILYKELGHLLENITA